MSVVTADRLPCVRSECWGLFSRCICTGVLKLNLLHKHDVCGWREAAGHWALWRVQNGTYCGDERNVYRMLVGESGGSRLFGNPRRRWKDNIKLDLFIRFGKLSSFWQWNNVLSGGGCESVHVIFPVPPLLAWHTADWNISHSERCDSKTPCPTFR